MKIRIALFVVVLVCVGVGLTCFDTFVQPSIATDLAMSQVNDSAEGSSLIRNYDAVQRSLPTIGAGIVCVSAGLLFGDRILAFVRNFDSPLQKGIAHEKHT